MNENLKRHRPDIKALGEGKAIAFMPEDPMGVWVHIQEVRDLLDVKDRTIRDFEENWIPRPKMPELKPIRASSPELGEYRVYGAEEVDRVLATKDKEISDLKKKLAEHEDCAANACAERDKIIKDLTDERSTLRKIVHDRKENYLEMQTKADRLEDKCLAKDGTIEELKASNCRLAKLVGERSTKMLSFRKAMWKAISNWARLEALRWLEREKACPLGSDREGFCVKRRHLWERVGNKGTTEVTDYETLRDNLLTMHADAIASGKGIATAEQPMRIIGK